MLIWTHCLRRWASSVGSAVSASWIVNETVDIKSEDTKKEVGDGADE